MTSSKNHSMKHLSFPILLGVLALSLATPAVAQNASIPAVLPAPAEFVPAQTPVDNRYVPTIPTPSSTEDLSFTLIPPDPSTAPSATPVNKGPTALDLSTQARITNLAANVSTRMEMLTQRFEQIAKRLEARIALEKAAGKDTSAAEAAWADAVATLMNVKTQTAVLDTKVQNMVSSPDSYAAWGELKISYFDISAQLRRAHQSLTTGVTSLR